MSLDIESKGVSNRAVSAHELSSAEPTRPSRDTAIDFTKGALVLFMVFYHWLNYFVGTNGDYYKYLRFLTPSFIFISGFMISRVHLSRYENGRRLSKRLIIRGSKLLALAFLLNVLVSVASAGFKVSPAGLATICSKLWWAFIVANPAGYEGQKSVAFSVLVPIAYLLMLSAGLVMFNKREWQAFSYALLALIVAISSLYIVGNDSPYLDLVAIGILGVVIGFVQRGKIELVMSHAYALIILYVCYLVVITMWAVTLSLQVTGVILTTALLYVAGSKKRSSGSVWRRTVLLGKYSLLGYVSQIAILQGLRKISWLSQQGLGVLLASFVVGALLTLVAVEGVNFARRRSTLADVLYRLVFA